MLSKSPFTGSQQTAEFDHRLWTVDLSLPPMKRAEAVEWQAFLLQLHGRRGTFLLGDPDAASARGSASGAILTNGSAVAGQFVLGLTTQISTTISANITLTTNTLDGTINDSVTTLDLTNATGFPSSGTLRIDSEDISYTGKSSNQITGLTRGANSTTAASHSDNALVTLLTESGTSITVASAANFTSVGTVEVGSEKISFSGRSGTTLTGLTRGASGTTVNTHSSGASITLLSGQTNATGFLKKGDWVQVGGGSAAKLHMVMADVDTDANGNCSITVEPQFKAAISSGTSVVVSSAKGLFRLSSDEIYWDANHVSNYGITIACKEAF